MTLLGGLVFYVLIVELSFKLDDIGVTSTATIGAASAIASLGTAIGGFLFGRLATRGPATTVPLAFGLSGVGLVGMGLASSVPTVVAFAVVAGFGNGLILPSLLTWALAPLTFEQRGRGTGVWTSAFFIGQFVCPLVVLALSGAFSLGTAILVLGVVSVAAAVGVRMARPVAVARAGLSGAGRPAQPMAWILSGAILSSTRTWSRPPNQGYGPPR